MNRKNEYKDLEKWRATCNRYNTKYYARTVEAENRKQPYTEHEVALILEHSVTDTQLSKIIGRSVKAIQVKRAKLKNYKEEN